MKNEINISAAEVIDMVTKDREIVKVRPSASRTEFGTPLFLYFFDRNEEEIGYWCSALDTLLVHDVRRKWARADLAQVPCVDIAYLEGIRSLREAFDNGIV